MDLLLAGEVKDAMEVATRRMTAVQYADKSNGKWSVAKHMKSLMVGDSESMAGANQLKAAITAAHLFDKATIFDARPVVRDKQEAGVEQGLGARPRRHN